MWFEVTAGASSIQTAVLELRPIPGMVVVRPADANETVAAWRMTIERRDGPVALVLTRQGLLGLDLSRFRAILAGVPTCGNVLADFPPSEDPAIILIAIASALKTTKVPL